MHTIRKKGGIKATINSESELKTTTLHRSVYRKHVTQARQKNLRIFKLMNIKRKAKHTYKTRTIATNYENQGLKAASTYTNKYVWRHSISLSLRSVW